MIEKIDQDVLCPSSVEVSVAQALPSLRQLGYLVALADRQSFTQAAQVCHVTQSTLSAGIQELERTLGARLVERDRHRVLITPLGAEVVERSRELLTSAADLVDRVAVHAKPMTGVLRLGAIPTIAPFLVPEIVRQVRSQHPELKLALREDRTDALLAGLRTAELDFALIALPYDTGALLVRALFSEQLRLLSPRPHAPRNDAEAQEIDMDRIDPHRLLLLEEGHCLRSHTLDACGLAERANASEFEATSLLTLVHMVASGLGDALVPQMAVGSSLLANAAVCSHSFASRAPTRTIALVARARSSRRQEFEMLAELVSSLHAPGDKRAGSCAAAGSSAV